MLREFSGLGLDPENRCPSALAPMQDVTGLGFMRTIARRGPPDFFFTEFFRVHAHSKLDEEILDSITKNPTEVPVFAQLIGENLEDMGRTVEELQKYPIAGIDLNFGCPAPRVYKKNVGGGLLRTPKKIDCLLAHLRQKVKGNLTVKMRIGFEDDRHFYEILDLLAIHRINLLSLHVRTVKGGYNTAPQYQYVTEAQKKLKNTCPVLLNGSISNALEGFRIHKKFKSSGIMIGRAAIANPWIFRQLREIRNGLTPFSPTLGDLHEYLIELFEEIKKPEMKEEKMVARIKKFLNFVGLSLKGKESFLNEMRRAVFKDELFSIFSRHLLNNGNSEQAIPYA